MAIPPSTRNLLIPGKSLPDAHDGYQKDAQTIEIWARQPIQQLIAGSNITLSPASGLATDSKGNGPQPITISATGGGGGAGGAAFVDLSAGPDASLTNARPYVATPMSSGAYAGSFYDSHWPVFSNSSGGTLRYGVGSTWTVDVGAGITINSFPTVTIPAFTGGPVEARFMFFAVSYDFVNQAGYGLVHSFASGGSYTFVAADLQAYTGPVGDAAQTAAGIISTAGSIPYLCGVNGYVSVPNGTTFTGGGGGGGITTLASPDGSIAITNPMGPTTDIDIFGWPYLPFSDSSQNTGVGSGANFASLAGGTANTAVGLNADFSLTSGTRDTAVGVSALSNVTSGSHNTAVGYQALDSVTTPNFNTAIGEQAGAGITTGHGNTSLGYSSMNVPGAATVNFGTAVGYGTDVRANGGVCIGTDAAGNVSTVTVANDFVLGTANHTVKISNNTTGAGSAALGANSPAVTNTAPYTWFKMKAGDGSVVYVPAWK